MRGLAFYFTLWITAQAAAPVAHGGCIKSAVAEMLREVVPAQGDESQRQAITRQLRTLVGQAFKTFNPRNQNEFVTAVFFPIVGPLMVLDETRSVLSKEGPKAIWKVPFRLTRKSGGVIMGGLTVSYAAGRLSIDQVDFDEETAGFENQLGKLPYVYVDLLKEGDVQGSMPAYEFANGPAKHARTHLVKAKDLAEVVERLREIERVEGEAVYGLQLFTHGLPGELGEENTISRELRTIAADDTGYAVRGRIKLNSCLTGLGNKGEAFVKDLGHAFLPNGGEIYAARVPIYSNNLDRLAKSGSRTAGTLGAIAEVYTHSLALRIGDVVNQAFHSIEAGGGEMGVVNRVRRSHVVPRSRMEP